MDSINSFFRTIQDTIAWLPDDIIGLVIVIAAMLIALSLHRWVRRVVRHFLAERHPYLFSVFTEMRGVTQLALVIVALSFAISVAPFTTETTEWLSRFLLIAVIFLIGWSAVAALNIAAGLYLRRFRIDVDDNLLARKHVTQVRVLLRAAYVLVVLVTFGAALMTFPAVRQYGVSLFASAGVAGIVAGLAARPVLSNLFAGVQLAMTQPIRIDDAVIVENEWGVIEEIASTYVVVRIWDLRRMIVPLSYFIEKPFQNWTREGSALIGSAMIYVDYSAPVGIIRDKLNEIVKASKNWNGEVINLQVTDAKERTLELRAIMSANSAGRAFDLRCEVREKLIDFLQREHPYALPRQRTDVVALPAATPASNPRPKTRKSAASRRKA
jgi:small-conductance mechanosensitive channel